MRDRYFDGGGRRRRRLSILAFLAMALAIAGAINWGLFGLAGYDFVAALCGPGTRLSKIVYGLVALGGLYCVFLLPRAMRTGG